MSAPEAQRGHADFSGVKFLFFDFMGTCLDWHASITACFETLSSEAGCQLGSRADCSRLALAWRKGFFHEIHRRYESRLPQENIDDTHRRVLDHLLDDSGWSEENFSMFSIPHDSRAAAVRAWHSMAAWDDVAPTLRKLQSRGYELFVLANGTTRLQLDLARSSGLNQVMDLLFSSELLQLTKPDPQIYRRGMGLVGAHSPDQCAMIAAHAYDTRAARQLGMRSIYVYRWTEDQDLDLDIIKAENDVFIDDGFTGLLDLLPGQKPERLS